MNRSDRRRPPILTGAPDGLLGTGAVALLSAVLALWMDLSPLQRYHNGDSVIPFLVSLQRWTPFFWEQNRFGMLLPLLALPLRNPWHNLLFQVWLRLLALVLSFFLLARVAVPRRTWPAVGGAALGLFLAVRSVPHLAYLHEQPYFQAMALALGGVLLLESGGWGRRTGGSLLVALAFWISPGTLFWLAPLLVLLRMQKRSPHGLFLFILLLACFGASLAASALYGRTAYGGTDLGTAPVADWPRGWRRLAEETMRYLSPGWVAALGLLFAAAALLRLAGRARGRLALAAGLCLAGGALGEIAVLGTSGWVHRQLFDVRYLASGLTLLTVAGPALFFCLVLEKTPAAWQRSANALVLAALIPLTLFRFGLPSPARARAALDAGLGKSSETLLASGTTHVIGNFWRVWPAVFHTNLLLFEHGEARRVWGITFRSAPTRSLWAPADWSRARFAVLGPDGEAEWARRHFGIPPLGRVIHPGIVRRMDPAPPLAAEPEAAQAPGPPLDFYPVRPCRLLDTLWTEPLVSGAPPLRIEVAGAGCGIPRGARAVAVNVQAVLPPSTGRIAVFPADRPAPRIATLGFRGSNGIVSSFQILPLSEEPRGALALAATVEDGGDVRVFLDVSGYFRSRPQSR